MKKLMLALLVMVSIASTAQTADQVIQNYSAAIGGLSAFNKITTAKITGTVSTQGMELPLTMQLINGKAMRLDVAVMGKEITNVYNNGKAWKLNPFAGATVPQDVTGAELITFKAQASLANNLIDYKSRGHQVELVGQETVEGVKVYKIKLTNKDDGKLTYYYIDASTNLLIKTSGTREINGTEYNSESLYSDTKDINGLKFAMQITVSVDGKPFQDVHYDKIELNVPVDEKIFIMPAH